MPRSFVHNFEPDPKDSDLAVVLGWAWSNGSPEVSLEVSTMSSLDPPPQQAGRVAGC